MHKFLIFAPLALFSLTVFADGSKQKFKTGDISTPYIEHGQLKNPSPTPAPREPGPAEKAVKKVIDSPVRPAVIDGKPGIEYHKTTP